MVPDSLLLFLPTLIRASVAPSHTLYSTEQLAALQNRKLEQPKKKNKNTTHSRCSNGVTKQQASPTAQQTRLSPPMLTAPPYWQDCRPITLCASITPPPHNAVEHHLAVKVGTTQWERNQSTASSSALSSGQSWNYIPGTDSQRHLATADGTARPPAPSSGNWQLFLFFFF